MFLSNTPQLAVGTCFSNCFEEGPVREREALVTTMAAMGIPHRRAIPSTATRPTGGPRKCRVPSRTLDAGLVCCEEFIIAEQTDNVSHTCWFDIL